MGVVPYTPPVRTGRTGKKHCMQCFFPYVRVVCTGLYAGVNQFLRSAFCVHAPSQCKLGTLVLRPVFPRTTRSSSGSATKFWVPTDHGMYTAVGLLPVRITWNSPPNPASNFTAAAFTLLLKTVPFAQHYKGKR